ncbi:chorion class B protein PC10-like [Anticarsia gemmatalis]|uniref:chorion class B protein PC10-like n=1 Tax=Anticarsia gemmatalis TaxID=129554 RepID=UPI003F767BF4
MRTQVVFVVCFQALLVQMVTSQCGNPVQIESSFNCASPSQNRASIPSFNQRSISNFGYGSAYGSGIGYALPFEVTPTNGGSFPVSSTSSVHPTGISVTSDNAYNGQLTVVGELPFLSTANLKADIPSVGAGVINYGCGDGRTGIREGGPGAGVATVFGEGLGNRLGGSGGEFGYSPCGCTGF